METIKIPEDYQQMVILARHGESELNAEYGQEESRVQGSGPMIRLSEWGEKRSYAFGFALGRFTAAHELEIVSSYASDALRAMTSQELSLRAMGTNIPQLSDPRLREICKGDLEGMLAKDAYPPEVREIQNDWHYRHGSKESGGETAYEAGGRWLDWFVGTVERMRTDSHEPIIAFGHNVATSSGLWRLLNPETPAEELKSRENARPYRAANSTALVVVKQHNKWSALSGRIIPNAQELERAGVVV